MLCNDHSCVSAVGSRTAPYQQQGGRGCRERGDLRRRPVITAHRRKVFVETIQVVLSELIILQITFLMSLALLQCSVVWCVVLCVAVSCVVLCCSAVYNVVCCEVLCCVSVLCNVVCCEVLQCCVKCCEMLSCCNVVLCCSVMCNVVRCCNVQEPE